MYEKLLEGCAGSPLFALNMTSKMWRLETGEQLEHYGEGRRRRHGALCKLRRTEVEAKRALGRGRRQSTLRSNGGWMRRRRASCHSSSKPWPASLDTCLHSDTHAHDPEGIGYHFPDIGQYLNTSSSWNPVTHKMNQLHFQNIFWSISLLPEDWNYSRIVIRWLEIWTGHEGTSIGWEWTSRRLSPTIGLELP